MFNGSLARNREILPPPPRLDNAFRHCICRGDCSNTARTDETAEGSIDRVDDRRTAADCLAGGQPKAFVLGGGHYDPSGPVHSGQLLIGRRRQARYRRWTTARHVTNNDNFGGEPLRREDSSMNTEVGP